MAYPRDVEFVETLLSGTCSSLGNDRSFLGARSDPPLLKLEKTVAGHILTEPPCTSVMRRGDALRECVQRITHLLPAQGPITVFVHHNTLHAFEHLPFEQAVILGSRLFGCQPYLPEERYRQEMSSGRIRAVDLSAVLLEDLGDRADELLGLMGTRFHLRWAMLEHPLRTAPAVELRWLVAETDALSRFRDEVPAAVRQRIVAETKRWVTRDLLPSLPEQHSRRHAVPFASGILDLLQDVNSIQADQWEEPVWESLCLRLLWRICHQGVHGVARFDDPDSQPIRHRDLLGQFTSEDCDLLVHDLLIRFCASFFDQGMASRRMPNRDCGFYRCFLQHYGLPFGPPDGWLASLRPHARRLLAQAISPEDSILESLQELGVPDHEWYEYLAASLLALRGWAGMIWQLETRGDRASIPAPPGTLMEFLAVRLLLDRLALAWMARERMGFNEPLARLRKVIRRRLSRQGAVRPDQRAFLVFQLAQFRGWTPEDLFRLSKPEWTRIVRELEQFSGIERRRIWHLAYERKFRHQLLDALSVGHASSIQDSSGKAEGVMEPNGVNSKSTSRPNVQWITCIDDREESLRRYLEESDPACETFGAAGFFGVPMYYRGAADRNAVPLCPIMMKPQHMVHEEVTYSFRDEHLRKAKARSALATVTHRVQMGSRTLWGGFFTALLGPLASIPLVAGVLFPRLTARTRKLFARFVQPPRSTVLVLERHVELPPSAGIYSGFSISEMADSVEKLLRDIGLASEFARLVVIIGHGSSSVNNPHESAYNCGACGGGRGGPNARAIASMGNHARVRELLCQRGLAIPRDTWFLGLYHNTCDDHVTFFDEDHVPPTHVADLQVARENLDESRKRNARERSRRFDSAPLSLTMAEALRHVEARSEDLSQTRPEFNHATNAACVVGRRRRTRGLFLDRRVFLHSYDPTQDDEHHSILARILQAVIPVCSGINLEYYFSTVDVTGYGCGTKLPHNVTSLLGVMDGAASDLRPGLSSQMTEIHEPVRLLIVIETTPDAMQQLLDRHEAIGRLCRNKWIQLATLDPASPQIHYFVRDQFVPYRPEVDELPARQTSEDWYRGWRDHLDFAVIQGMWEPTT